MSKFSFFTDPSLLDPQTDEEAFGPADSLPGRDQFRVTDVHTSSSAALPAVAVCDGVLCAQEEEGQNTLTLILKPSQAPPFESPVVSYFIYKGVDKASLLDGDQILAEDAVKATDFTKRIAKEWKKQNEDNLDGSSAALGLDRDASFEHDDGTSQIHVFTDNDPIERLFTYPHKTVQLPTVAAGEMIGSFDSSCGFEVHLQRLGYKPKLGFARSADNQIFVASLTADNGGMPWEADDSAFFAHWHAKEQVLAFMDPCAYFGSFVQSKLAKKSGSSGSTVKGSHIYQEILQKFSNRNIAWLDIRNNYSYSYNLFGLYDDKIRFVAHSGGQTNDMNFRSGSWPILKLQIADVPGSKRGSIYRTKLSLPAGQSTAPAVLVSKGFVKNLGPERPKSKAPAIARAGPGDTNYTPFRLAFPVTVDNSDPVFTASYTRINIYEKPHHVQPGAALLDVAGGDYLDGVFRPRDLQLDKDFAGNSLRFEIFPEEVLIDLEEENGPAYSATVGIVEDADSLALFTFPSYFLTNDSEAGHPWAVASWTDSAGNLGPNLQTWLKNKFLRATITKATTNPGAQNELDLVIVRTSDPGARAALDGLGNIIDYSFIIFKKDDYMSFLAQIDDDADWGPVLTTFLTVANTVTRQDTTNTFTYLAKTMQATGYARNSNSAAKLMRLSMSYSKEVLGYADF